VLCTEASIYEQEKKMVAVEHITQLVVQISQKCLQDGSFT